MRVIRPVPVPAARGLVAEVYAEIRRDFGAVVEPFTLFSPLPTLLAGAWVACRETLVVGQVPRAHKEVVATAVSRANRCPYCVDAHAVMLVAAGQARTGSLLVDGRGDEITDPTLRAIAAWAERTATSGHPTLSTPPFPERDAGELVGTVVVFHFVNRMVSALLGDSPLPSRTVLPSLWRRVAGWFFARALRAEKRSGASAAQVEEPPVVADFEWALGSPHVSRAFAQLASAVDEAGRSVLSASATKLIRRRLDDWAGETVPLSRSWTLPILADLEDAERPPAQLALLAALAPHQIDDGLLRALRDRTGGDAGVVATLAWGAFEAARRIGRWSVPGHFREPTRD